MSTFKDAQQLKTSMMRKRIVDIAKPLTIVKTREELKRIE